MTKEEVKAGLLKCARKLGRTPTYAEARQMSGVPHFWIQEHFATLSHALREAGLEPAGRGHRIETAALMEDWARLARKLGRLPMLADYRKLGRFSVRPFFERCKSWVRVPGRFGAWVRDQEQEKKWADVLRMIEAADEARGVAKAESAAAFAECPVVRRKVRRGRPIYGEPLNVPGLRYEPVNEQGVVYVFGMMAHKLGFEVERMQQGFPDCEAMRRVERGKWQRAKIEIEFASRNYLTHRHPLDGCDVIVCWVHDWPECPKGIEVIELRKMLRRAGDRGIGPSDHRAIRIWSRRRKAGPRSRETARGIG